MLNISGPKQYEKEHKNVIENNIKHLQDDDVARTSRREELRALFKELRDSLAQPGGESHLTEQEIDYMYNLVTKLYNEIAGNIDECER